MGNNMLGKITKKLGTLPFDMLGAIFDLLEKLGSAEGDEWLAMLKKFLRKEENWGFVRPRIKWGVFKYGCDFSGRDTPVLRKPIPESQQFCFTTEEVERLRESFGVTLAMKNSHQEDKGLLYIGMFQPYANEDQQFRIIVASTEQFTFLINREEFAAWYKAGCHSPEGWNYSMEEFEKIVIYQKI